MCYRPLGHFVFILRVYFGPHLVCKATDVSLLYNVSHRRYGWHSLARRGLSKSLSKCLSPVCAHAELHERRFKRWCAATLGGDKLDRLVAYDRPSIVLIAGDDGSAQIFGAPNGRHFTVRDLLDAMVKHEKRLMRFPTGHAHFVGLRQHERWPAMYYVVWEWYPDEGEPFLIE